MKHLYDYIIETLLLESDDNNDKNFANKIIKSLGNTDDPSLSSYVDKLNEILKDKDGKAILQKLFGSTDIKKKYKVGFDGEMKFIKASKLHPTQTEIDINKSIVYPFLNADNAKTTEKYKKGAEITFPFPLITFNSQWVVDGHHRWSGVYSFNKDCKIACFNLTVSSNEPNAKVTEQTVLKIVQACLAAKRAEDGKGQIPQEKVEGANIFKMSDDEIKDTVKSYCNGSVYDSLSDKEKKKAGSEANIKEAAKKIEKIYDKDENGLIDFIAGNLEDLKKNNEKFAQKGNNRGVMPQTDKGGDNPDDASTAHPEKEGSALNNLVKGGVNINAVPHK